MRARARIANTILLVASLAIALTGAEAAARLLGYTPFVPIEDNTGVLQEWNQVDRKLGWIYRANSFNTFAGRMRIWPDATRRTRSDENSDPPGGLCRSGAGRVPTDACVHGCGWREGQGADGRKRAHRTFDVACCGRRDERARDGRSAAERRMSDDQIDWRPDRYAIAAMS
jgi:hypothetical protein